MKHRKIDPLLEKYIAGIDPLEAIEWMWASNGSRSHLKGSLVEYSFNTIVKNLGWKAEKVGDQDDSKRYDFDVSILIDVITPVKTYRFEIKTLMPKLKVDTGFRDYRDVWLPSGRLWKTKSRHISEDFDYLAICLVNYEGYTIQDFLYIPFKCLPRLCVKDKKQTPKREAMIFTEEERTWIKNNYIDSSLVVPSLIPINEYFNVLGSLG